MEEPLLRQQIPDNDDDTTEIAARKMPRPGLILAFLALNIASIVLKMTIIAPL